MAKQFTVITESGPVVAPQSAKATLVNSSVGAIFLTNDEIDNGLNDLPYNEQQTVLNALYAIAPGASQVLSAGTYNLTFSVNYMATAVLIVETEPKSKTPTA